MKRIILVLIVLLQCCFLIAQKNRRGSDEYAIDATGGFTFKGFSTSLAFSLHDKYNPQIWGRAQIAYTSTKIDGKDVENFNRDITFPVNLIDLTATYNRTIIQVPKRTRVMNMHAYFSLDAGVGALIGYEKINNRKYRLDTGEEILDRSKFTYGGVVRMEAEFYFDIPNLTAFLSVEQKYLMNSDISKGRFTMNFGLRYWLNDF